MAELGAPPPKWQGGLITTMTSNQSGRLYRVDTALRVLFQWQANWPPGWNDLTTYLYAPDNSINVVLFRSGEMAGLRLGSTQPIAWTMPLPLYDGSNGVRIALQMPDLSTALYVVDRAGNGATYTLSPTGARQDWVGQWQYASAWERGGAFRLNNENFLFLHSNSPPCAGIVALGTPPMALWRSNIGNWAKSWSFVSPVVFDRTTLQPYVFMYSSERDEAAIEVINGPTQGTAPTWSKQNAISPQPPLQRLSIGYALPGEAQAVYAFLHGLYSDSSGKVYISIYQFTGPTYGLGGRLIGAALPTNAGLPDRMQNLISPGPLPP